jgi:hypothetical protein
VDLQEKARLEKLLGMLGSSFDGERANAARMIAQMAEKKKLTITELIYGSQRQQSARPPWEEKPQPKPQPKPQTKAKTKPAWGASSNSQTMLSALKDIAANSDSFEFVLTAWECQFAADVSNRYAYDYELSEKQIVIVEKILRKVEVAQGAG